ncbi:hypothetical protein [Gordonia hankookensis]|uniref:TetR family transcriptional regulator n=1 Tax=Gordonia hankookensis TaxID=589403 RepID=A0ABR7W5A0_9ACTN|nr:hypothetical protein [Gordonia hankookensis]MBD1318004.1 hypothetical protein [Gordonia hankookensis]
MGNEFGSSATRQSAARTVTEASSRGIRAARAHDLEGFTECVEELEPHADAARIVHSHLVRELLETSYQDGLSGEDVSEVLRRTVTGAGGWNVAIDPEAVVTVLTGALGVVEPPEGRDAPAPVIPPTAIIAAAILVAADLAAHMDLDPEPYLGRAVDEIRRAQAVEMP